MCNFNSGNEFSIVNSGIDLIYLHGYVSILKMLFNNARKLEGKCTQAQTSPVLIFK